MSQVPPHVPAPAVPPLNPPSSLDIAFWIDPAMLAGEAAFVRHLVMGLKSEGQEITFIAPHGTSLAELPVLGSRVLTYRWNPWERLPMLQKLRIGPLARELAARPPDVLIAWGGVGGGVLLCCGESECVLHRRR